MDFLNRLILKKLPIPSIENNDAIHILNENELHLIKKEYHNALWQSALLGFLGVLFYYIPMYFLPILSKTVSLTILKFPLQLPLYDIALCIILTVLEIYFLTFIHLRMTHNIAVITGYINEENKNHHLEKITKIATVKPNKEIIKYGLNPFQEINKAVLIFINTLIKLKGFLANKVLRYLIKRFAGRYAVKYLMDFAGAPIYMALNAYATYIVYKNTKAEIFGIQLIDRFIKSLDQTEISASEKELIYDALQLIAISKQDFHPNHAVLTENVIKHYKIPIKKEHLFKPDFFERFENASTTIQLVCNQIITIGLLLDGQFSFREKKKVKQLIKEDIFNFSIDEIAIATHQFINGKEINLLPF
ncbi:MAG: hypothetical protein QM535_00555 [Limnohabitans sp.]|nr:hypothetical protein [Limnohabitans sp.]